MAKSPIRALTRRGGSIGAAIQGGVLAGDVRTCSPDVTPPSLVWNPGRRDDSSDGATRLIPIKKTQVFSTAEARLLWTSMLQGERPMAADNMTLGRFIDGIPGAAWCSAGTRLLSIIDANGI